MQPIAWGVVGALVVVVLGAFKYQGRMRKDFLNFLSNHMSESTKALEGLTTVVHTMNILMARREGREDLEQDE